MNKTFITVGERPTSRPSAPVHIYWTGLGTEPNHSFITGLGIPGAGVGGRLTALASAVG